MLNTLAWTLLHFLWQGTLLALLFALAQRFLASSSARARYAAAASAMLAMPLSGLVTFFYLAPTATAPAAISSTGSFTAALAPTVHTAQALAASSRDYLPWLAYAWMAGVLLLSLRMLGQWTILQRYRRIAIRPVEQQWQRSVQLLAQRLRLRRPIRLYESAIADVPAVVGWLRPVILIPVSALTQLTPGQVEALLAHELAHIRRHDYLINLLQTSVETLFFYHPAVWWVGRCMRQEREHCCDDIAVQVCGDAVVYARALADLEQLRFQMPALAMAANGGSLLKRIERLILPQPARTAPAALWLTACGLIAATLVVWATPSLHVSAKVLPFAAQAAQPAPKPTAQPAPKTSASPKQSGADGESFLDSLERNGVKDLTIDQMVAFKIHGVTGDFIQSIRAAGYQPDPDQLVALRIHGVTPEFIREMKSLGWSPSLDQLVSFKIHGVDAASLDSMKQLGYELDPDNAVAMKIHGLTPDVARALNGLGYGKATFDQLIAMRIHGIDPEFAASWKKAGVQDLDLDKLIALRIHNANVADVKAMEALGFHGLNADRIIAMRIFDITPEFIRQAQKHGFKDLDFDRIVKLKQFGLLDKE
ncbi:M56 family metallopeptidase [Paludibaculum fermentans]|uniref:M56 family metallopeptidase n=1 Tax=Paludibaculum fermentans TaxID=1473598 RepID=A0A7S7NX77_PALFE|nr:M56 family metallopeptidase [Paludibaculum fermentans]QOY91406.1 M56 family metallopeptidase [Paludibaculum fermentans]